MDQSDAAVCRSSGMMLLRLVRRSVAHSSLSRVAGMIIRRPAEPYSGSNSAGSKDKRTNIECPLYLQKRTLKLSRVMSALCQEQTSFQARPWRPIVSNLRPAKGGEHAQG